MYLYSYSIKSGSLCAINVRMLGTCRYIPHCTSVVSYFILYATCTCVQNVISIPIKCPKSDEHMEVMNAVVEWWDNDQNHLYREIDCSGAKSHTPMWEHSPPPSPPLLPNWGCIVYYSLAAPLFISKSMTAGIRILLDHMNKVTW